MGKWTLKPPQFFVFLVSPRYNVNGTGQKGSIVAAT